MTAEVALHRAPATASWPNRLLSVVPGGKALAVARAAATLGMPVRALVVLGGHAGDWMEAALRARAIDTRAVRIAWARRPNAVALRWEAAIPC